MKLSEAEIQKACEDLLRLDSWRIFRLEQQFSEKKRKCVGIPGAPDCLALRYDRGSVTGQILMIEWKAPGGRLSAAQRAFHAAERAAGATTWIAGVDFPPSIEGFWEHYRASGLARRDLKVGACAVAH